MPEFIEMAIPAGRPADATHYNPRFSLCWEKHDAATDQVRVYHPAEKSWSMPVVRFGGHLIKSN